MTNINQLTINQIHELCKSGQLSWIDMIHHYQTIINHYQTKNYTTHITIWNDQLINDFQTQHHGNLLFNIPFACKDNIATKHIMTTGSSATLINFKANYNGFVIDQLHKQHAIMLAKTTMDELGLGGDGLSACQGYITNPWNEKHIIGGSSSGSAALVTVRGVVFALASETGDSIRLTASYAGVVGFKPTYGLISRYGLFAYGPSLDTIGIMANYVADCAIVFDNIIGQDQRDYTSITSSETNYFTNLTSQINGYKIAYIQEIIDELPVHLKIEFDKIITLLKKQGCQVTVINFPIDLIKAIPIIYMIISYVEAISCLANLNGITFSQRPDHYEDFTALINHSRRDFMGKTVKRRHVIGSYILKYEPALIDKAKQIRRLISNQFNELLAQYDVIISPGSGNVAPLITDVINYQRSADDLHQNLINHSILLSNFNGAPSLNVPWMVVAGLPIGLNITAAIKTDQKVLNMGQWLETTLNFNQHNPFFNK